MSDLSLEDLIEYGLLPQQDLKESPKPEFLTWSQSLMLLAQSHTLGSIALGVLICV